jgi:deazaflavin-dependent oxidoreductase (nitroreductase family)
MIVAIVYRVFNASDGGAVDARVGGLMDEGLAASSVCDLETIGRVSGERRVVELWFAAAGDRLYFLSGGRDGAAWVRNIAAEPAVRVAFGPRWFRGRGAAIEGDPDEQLARRLLAAKYQGWRKGRRLSGWARESLPVAVDLEAEDRAR